MKIETIRLRNFRAFRDVELTNLPDFCVLVGANGTGKSTLFDVFGFLKDCLTYNATTAFGTRGGFGEVVSRDSQGDNIEIELQFRMPIGGVERLVTYHLELSGRDNRVLVEREFLRYKRGRYGSPYHFLDFERGEGNAVVNEEDFNKSEEQLDREEQKLDRPDVLAIKGLGQFQRFKAASSFRHLIENWHVSDFHISMARGSKEVAGYSEHLSANGENLQLVADYLFKHHRDVFNSILSHMVERVPGVSDIIPEPTPDGRLLLKFRDGAFEEPFIDKFVSDGTIKMFAYLTLLYDPNPHPLLCVEEPENQLYPTLLWGLAEEFRRYARRGGQVFVSTHSPDFLNATRVDEVIWLVKRDGYAKFLRASDDEQIVSSVQSGDQMGYLWKQGYFNEVDPN